MIEKKAIETVKSAEEARDLAINWQSHQEDIRYGSLARMTASSMSLNEVLEWQDYFEQLAEKFPEVRDEFKENAII